MRGVLFEISILLRPLKDDCYAGRTDCISVLGPSIRPAEIPEVHSPPSG